MSPAKTVPTTNTRLDIKRFARPLCKSAAIWTIRHACPIESHAMPCFEIDYVHAGEVTAILADGSRLHVYGGDVLILQPRVRHGCEHGVMTPANYLVLQVDPQPHLPCRPYSNQEIGDLLRVLRASGNRVVRACRETDAVFLALRDALAVPPELQQAAWFAPLVSNLTHRMFLCIVRSLSTPTHQPHFEAVDRVRLLIEGSLHEALPVSHLARTAGVSPARLVQLFHAQTGQTPADYGLRLRLEESRRRLQDPFVTITTIAADLGFCSSQHFASCFRKYFTLTPTACRRQAQKAAKDGTREQSAKTERH